MIWQNPWAWGGIATVALPVLIHLLGEGRARRQRFPTLRFFGAPRPLPTQRTRLHDLLLLAVRIGILVAAVTALAQPLFSTVARRSAVDNTLVRAVVVDSSASMQRVTTTGGTAAAAARRMAQSLADSAQTRITLPVAAPARAIPGALAWLARQSGRGELVVISDFQAGALDARDFAAVPPNVGVRLVRVGGATAPGPVVVHARVGMSDVSSTITRISAATQVEWRSTGAAPTVAADNLLILAGSDEARANAAALAASGAAVPLPLDSTRSIAIIFSQAIERAALLSQLAPLHTPWMADAWATMHRDSVQVGEATVRGRDRLVLLPSSEAGSLASAALIAAATHTLSIAPSPAELDPTLIRDSSLQAWQRPVGTAATVGSSAATGESDGRWFWIAALVLLAIEAWVRRGRPRLTVEAGAHDVAR